MDQKLSQLTTLPAIDRANDLLYVADVSAGSSNKATPNFVLGITGAPVGTTDVQTLSSKTITAPAISSPVLSGTITGTYTLAGTPTFPASVVTLTGSQTLTNKTLTSPTINTPTISNATITANAISGFTTTNTGTIYGVSIVLGIIQSAALVNQVNNAALQDSSVTPAKILSGTGTTWVWQTWVPSFTNLTVGNGTVSATYNIIGKTVNYRLSVIWGTTTSLAGTGIIYSLPVPALGSWITSGNVSMIGTSAYRDISPTTGYFAFTRLVSTTTADFVHMVAATSVTTIAPTSTVPFTWTTGDTLWAAGTYEAA